MTKIDKLKQRFLSYPKDFTWSELVVLLKNFGYSQYNAGKTSGSRVRFIHTQCGDIMMHKPHPRPDLKVYQIKQIIEQLKKQGLL